MTIVKTSVWKYLDILLHFLVNSEIFKMILKTFGNNGKNIIKLNFEQNINLCCIIICAEETDF